MIKKVLFSLLVLSFLVVPLSLNAQSADDIAQLIAKLEQQIAYLKQQLAQLQGQQGQQSWCFTFEKNLGVGSSGKDVDALHTILVKEGFTISPLPVSARVSTGTSYQEVEVEKSKVAFTEATAAAVSGFQLKYAKEILAPLGLANPTGYVGPATRAVLNRLYSCRFIEKPPRPIPLPTPVPPGPIPPKQPLTVISPNGGEAWQKGTEQLIQWSWGTNTFAGQQFTIYLNPIPTPCPMTTTGITATCEVTPQWKIASGISGTSYYKWNVGKTTTGTPPAGAYYAQICSPNNYGGQVCDQSDSYFKIYDSDQGGNLPPSISGVSGPTTLKIGETGTWTVQASDPENGPLSYSVSWGDEGMMASGSYAPTMEKVQQTATFTHSYAQAGTYYPKFKVTDNAGQSNSASLSVVVGGGAVAGTDLSVKNFTLNSTGPYGVFCNSGNTYLKNFPFSITVNNIQRDFDFGTAINPGQCNGPHQWYYATWGFNAMTSSGYEGKVIVDPKNIYAETNEDNNEAKSSYGGGTVPNQLLTLFSPNGGESWQKGSSYPIQWKTNATDVFIRISISNFSGNWYPVYSKTDNDGIEYWTIPSTIKSGTYWMSVSLCRSDNDCYWNDWSDSYFKISGDDQPSNQPPKIVTPSGNPIVSVGETVNIALIASDPDGDRLSMSVDWGDNIGYGSICPTNPTPSNLFGNQELKASHVYSAAKTYDVTARIIDCRGGEAKQSLQVEVKPLAASTLQVLSPNGGETWFKGQKQIISWGATGAPEVSVYLVKDSNPAYRLAIKHNHISGRANSIEWTVPGGDTAASDIAVGSDYRIWVIGGGTTAVEDKSDAPFNIAIATTVPPVTGAVKIISPNGGQTLNIGSETMISWSDSAPSGNDEYKIFAVSGANKYLVGSMGGLANGLLWKVGSYEGGTLLPGYAYIRIEKYRGGTLISSDNSDSQFTLSGGTPSLRVQSPNGGETIVSGRTDNAISYSASGIDRVDIQLRRVDTGATYLLFKELSLAGGNSSGGFFANWTPKLENYGGGASGDFVVKICQTGTTFCDESDASFKIVAP